MARFRFGLVEADTRMTGFIQFYWVHDKYPRGILGHREWTARDEHWQCRQGALMIRLFDIFTPSSEGQLELQQQGTKYVVSTWVRELVVRPVLTSTSFSQSWLNTRVELVRCGVTVHAAL